MSGLTIITNNVPRPVVEAWELTETERKDFDYLDWAAIERGEDSRSFVRYKGWTYDLGDFGEGTFPADRRWFYQSDSFFSGVLMRYPEDESNYPLGDWIVCGRYYC